MHLEAENSLILIILILCFSFTCCSKKDLPPNCDDIESLSIQEYGRYSAEESSYRSFMGTSQYGRDRVSDTVAGGWTHSDSLKYLSAYELGHYCQITSSIDIYNITLRQDTQYLAERDPPIKEGLGSAILFVKDGDLVYGYYLLIDSSHFSNWMVVTNISRDSSIIEGEFELHFAKEKGNLSPLGWLDTLHLVNGQFQSVYNIH